MRRHLIGVILAVLLVASALGQPLADRVPNDALVYIGWRGGSDVPAQYADSHLKAVLDNCKIRELFSQFLPQAVARFSASNPQARQPLETMQYILSQVWSHPTAFYFAGVAINTPQPMPKLAIICQAGTDAAAIQQRIQTLLDSSGEPTPIRCFVADDFVIVAIGYMQAADAMAVPGSGLATSSSFTTAMKQVQADPVFAAYVDVEKVLDIVESMAQLSPDEQAREKVPKAIDALGLRGLKRIVCTSGFDGKDWMSQTFVDAPSPRTGLLEMLDAAPISPDLLKSIPADSTFVATMRFDAAKLITKIREAAGQVDPRAQQIVDMATGAVQVALAKNPLTDVLQPLGEDWAIYCSPSVAGNGALEIVGVNHLNDPAKAQASLPTASINLSNWIAVALAHERSQVTITEKSTQIDGQRIYYFGLPIVAPAWTINNGNLYFGLYPQTAAAAARWTTLNQPSILDNEKFVALQKRLGVSNACSVSFYDLPATISNGAVYQQWLVIDRYCGFGDLFGLTLPEPLLPMMNILQQHLSPAGSAAWVDAAGYHSKSISPFPGSTLLSEPGMLTCAGPGASALMVSILLPSLNRARETANRVKCASDMRQIGMAIIMYGNDHKGKYPPDLGTLILEEDIVPEVFVCPSGSSQLPGEIKNAPKDKQAAWVNEHSDYIYLGAGKNSSVGADVILLYEKQADHNGDGMNMLYGDGHVEFQRMQDANQLLQNQGAPNVGP